MVEEDLDDRDDEELLFKKSELEALVYNINIYI